MNLTFFHNSDNRIDCFNPKADGRPSFYWFNDRYHNHVSIQHKDLYFHLFVKNPKLDNIGFRARHEALGFHGLYSNYIECSKKRSELYQNGKYSELIPEPSILMSFSVLIPDLIIKFNNPKSGTGIILHPREYFGTEVSLFNNNQMPLPFNEIPEILRALPQIKDSLPFTQPLQKDGEYVYDDWSPMVTEHIGIWG